MAKEQERGKDEPTTTKADQPDKKLTDLTADKKEKEVKGGGSGGVKGGGQIDPNERA